jgi:plastocyanin
MSGGDEKGAGALVAVLATAARANVAGLMVESVATTGAGMATIASDDGPPLPPPLMTMPAMTAAPTVITATTVNRRCRRRWAARATTGPPRRAGAVLTDMTPCLSQSDRIDILAMSLLLRKRPFPKRGIAAVAVGVSIVAGMTACGSDSLATPSGLPVATGPAITISAFHFSPDPLTAKVGDVVTVTNNDAINHTLTANDGSFDTGVFSSGSKAIHLIKAGIFAYHCNIHAFMTGTIRVSGG